jgi:hypothetical protein
MKVLCIDGYYNIYNDFIGNLNVVLLNLLQDSPEISIQALTWISSLFMLSQTVILEHFNCTHTKVEIKSLGFGWAQERLSRF